MQSDLIKLWFNVNFPSLDLKKPRVKTGNNSNRPTNLATTPIYYEKIVFYYSIFIARDYSIPA